MASSICIEGIDPGADGALAFLWPTEGLLLVENMPVVREAGTSRTFTYVDGEKLTDLVRRHQPGLAYLERVHAMPRDGAVGAFSFGDNYGTVKGVHAALGVPVHRTEPATWKANMGVRADKSTSVARAKVLFPGCSAFFTRADRAEAALIALYGALRSGYRITRRFLPHGGRAS